MKLFHKHGPWEIFSAEFNPPVRYPGVKAGAYSVLIDEELAFRKRCILGFTVYAQRCAECGKITTQSVLGKAEFFVNSR